MQVKILYLTLKLIVHSQHFSSVRQEGPGWEWWIFLASWSALRWFCSFLFIRSRATLGKACFLRRPPARQNLCTASLHGAREVSPSCPGVLWPPLLTAVSLSSSLRQALVQTGSCTLRVASRAQAPNL